MNYRVISEGSLEVFARKLEKKGASTSGGKKPTELISTVDRICRDRGLSEKDGESFFSCKIGMLKKLVGESKAKAEAQEMITAVAAGLDPKEVIDGMAPKKDMSNVESGA